MMTYVVSQCSMRMSTSSVNLKSLDGLLYYVHIIPIYSTNMKVYCNFVVCIKQVVFCLPQVRWLRVKNYKIDVRVLSSHQLSVKKIEGICVHLKG